MAYEKIKATASVTIVDETDASTLTGNMMVVKGSKSQIFITGQSNPYSPDWIKSNLVVRPFLQASNITKENLIGEEYNPDMFDPKEYPNSISTYEYIKDIHWYLRDSAGVERELFESNECSFNYTYVINDIAVVCNDKRQLVIRENILSKNTTADIICKFSFYDPFANMFISQQLETTITNIASGQSNNKLITSCITGNAINNTGASYIDIIAKFYDDTGEINIDDLIVSGDSNVSCLWYIRRYDGWMLLDPTELGQNNANVNTDMYKIKRINSYDSSTETYDLVDSTNARGAAAIRIFPSIISGSEVIKCVFTDSTGAKYNSLQIIYDTTDPTSVELYCSNGKRLKKGSIENTTIKAIVTYKGSLLEDDSSLYNTEFDYYWYKYTISDDVYVNVYNDNSNNLIENSDLAHPIKGKRTLFINSNAITSDEKEARFSLDLVEYGALTSEAAQASFYNSAVSEEDLATAMVINNSIGMNENDIDAAISTAQELNSLY